MCCMGVGDLFGTKKIENLQLKVQGQAFRIKELTEKLEQAEKSNQELAFKLSKQEELLTPEMQESALLQIKINQQKADIARLQIEKDDVAAHYDREILLSKKLLADTQRSLNDLREQLIITEEEVLVQSFGLYSPRYEFANSTKYKEELAKERVFQKSLIKEGKAVTGRKDWTVNGSAAEGKKLIKDTQKLLLRAFNTECEEITSKVKFNNIDASVKRIISSWESISKLGSIFQISISEDYCNSKVAELYLSYEYQLEKQKEKEELKRLRAEERERIKLEKEIQEARKKIEKEQKHYENALAKVLQQIKSASTTEAALLEEKRIEFETTLKELSNSMVEIDYRVANQKAGYVYVISNIGAFGENVYKIGMTRRLNPMERVDELGDASVPFDFDVHAMIFSDNAPALEAALHHAFEDRKLNMINTRREFFRVSLEEIKKVIQDNYDKTVEFYDVPMAEQYRQSELMRSFK